MSEKTKDSEALYKIYLKGCLMKEYVPNPDIKIGPTAKQLMAALLGKRDSHRMFHDQGLEPKSESQLIDMVEHLCGSYAQCSECHMAGGHKFDCSQRKDKGLTLPAKVGATTFREARDMMSRALQKDNMLLTSYLANVALSIFENSRLTHRKSNEIAQKILETLFDLKFFDLEKEEESERGPGVVLDTGMTLEQFETWRANNLYGAPVSQFLAEWYKQFSGNWVPVNELRRLARRCGIHWTEEELNLPAAVEDSKLKLPNDSVLIPQRHPDHEKVSFRLLFGDR